MELGGLAIAFSEKQDDEDDDNEYYSYYFLPVSHPTEPHDEEDRPVKCPHLPHSSTTTTTTIIRDINHNNSNEEEGAIRLMEKAELLSPKDDKTTPLPRAVRKRHHGLTNGENLIFTPPTKPAAQHGFRISTSVNCDIEKHTNIVIGSK